MHYGQSPKRVTVDVRAIFQPVRRRYWSNLENLWKFCKALFQQEHKVITTKDLNWGQSGYKTAHAIEYMIPGTVLHEVMAV